MAAASLQSSNLVWQKVKQALAGANPATQAAFRELKTYLATQKGNPNLQFVPFDPVDIDTGANGYNPIDDATVKYYGVYAKSLSTLVASSWVGVYDSDDDNATTTECIVALKMSAASQSQFHILPQGVALAKGIVIAAATAPVGTTESDAVDSSAGFVLIGA